MKQPNDEGWDEFHDPEIVDWKRVRGAIEHEDNLTNHRLGWLLTSQGFLLGAFAVVLQASVKEDVAPASKGLYIWTLVTLAAVGILVSVYLWAHMYAGTSQHNKLVEWWAGRGCSDRHPEVCWRLGGKYSVITRPLALHGFPAMFILGWGALLVVASRL